MRKYLMFAGLSVLSACSGGGTQSAGSNAPAGGASTGSSSTSTHTFVAPTEKKTYQSSAAVQSYSYNYNELVHYDKTVVKDAGGNDVLDANGFPTHQLDLDSRALVADYHGAQLYFGNTSTVRSPGATVTYDPRNATFTVAISQNGLNDNVTFQDPAHRTDFDGATTPQIGVPNLETGDPSSWRDKGVQYLEADTGSTATTYDVSTFFYELPGTTTKYVTYAGFVRNHFEDVIETVQADTTTEQVALLSRKTALERAAFVFGEATDVSKVPKTGSASFSGNMIASMVNNPTFDTTGDSTYFQWLNGTANVAVNFGTGSVTTTLAGTTLAPMYDPRTLKTPTDTSGYTFDTVTIPAGAAFAASSTGRIDLVGTGGFTGTFTSAGFTSGGTTTPVDIVGSSLDGAFYGPAAQELGATFRIVGGIPDQRVDIVGSFTGKK